MARGKHEPVREVERESGREKENSKAKATDQPEAREERERRREEEEETDEETRGKVFFSAPTCPRRPPACKRWRRSPLRTAIRNSA